MNQQKLESESNFKTEKDLATFRKYQNIILLQKIQFSIWKSPAMQFWDGK